MSEPATGPEATTAEPHETQNKVSFAVDEPANSGSVEPPLVSLNKG